MSRPRTAEQRYPEIKRVHPVCGQYSKHSIRLQQFDSVRFGFSHSTSRGILEYLDISLDLEEQARHSVVHGTKTSIPTQAHGGSPGISSTRTRHCSSASTHLHHMETSLLRQQIQTLRQELASKDIELKSKNREIARLSRLVAAADSSQDVGRRARCMTLCLLISFLLFMLGLMVFGLWLLADLVIRIISESTL